MLSIYNSSSPNVLCQSEIIAQTIDLVDLYRTDYFFLNIFLLDSQEDAQKR